MVTPSFFSKVFIRCRSRWSMGSTWTNDRQCGSAATWRCTKREFHEGPSLGVVQVQQLEGLQDQLSKPRLEISLQPAGRGMTSNKEWRQTSQTKSASRMNLRERCLSLACWSISTGCSRGSAFDFGAFGSRGIRMLLLLVPDLHEWGLLGPKPRELQRRFAELGKAPCRLPAAPYQASTLEGKLQFASYHPGPKSISYRGNFLVRPYHAGTC